ncbi:NADH dehydrogenase [Rubricella aquisinus]|uniref:NADH dehydrogenase n=1 Tax=Rubricella aquisinus TaxID=2028108 RepID=A0A840X0A6_9RHOB|nr:FAD-dependent oxidoreductase [Rubricella aquisinus]MBB5516830.1 NADH dehydrogenase [Rubricella aquisinus]
MKNVVIAGGGFAGVWAAMAAAATRQRIGLDDLAIELISDSGSLTIRPRLYEGARDDMRVPLQPLFDEIGVELTVGKITRVSGAEVQLSGGATHGHDRLVLATGSAIRVPAVPGADQFGFAVDTHDSTAILDQHLATLDLADDAAGTIVVVGASFTGLEVATGLRARLGAVPRIHILDQAATPGAGLGDAMEAEVATALAEGDIAFHAQTTVEEVTAEMVRLSNGSDLPCRTVIFATGFRASPLTATLEAERAADGRLVVHPDLRVGAAETVFAAGDVARAMADDTHATLMSCQHAMPMGIAAGRNAVLDLAGQSTQAYSQPFYATCLALGPYGAVFTTGWDRAVGKTRAEGAAMKTQINTQWIYPPDPSLGRDAIFEMILGN